MAVPVRKRILGKKLGLVIDGKDYWADIAKWELKASNSDKDIVTLPTLKAETRPNGRYQAKLFSL